MPLRIQNYGDWGGDKRGGHHPPACTCYRCNEERRRLEASKEEERRVAEYDRRTAESEGHTQSKRGAPKPTRPGGGQTRPSTTSQRHAAEAVLQPVAGARPAGRARTGGSKSSRKEGRVFRLSRAATASAIRYALALHAAAVLGLVVYALTQEGASGVLPTLSNAAEAYVHAWQRVGAKAGVV